MDDIVGRFVIIVVGAMLMFFVPLSIISLKQDDLAQAYIDNAVVEFVDNSRTSARITSTAYEMMMTKIGAVQPDAKVEIWHSAMYQTPIDNPDGTIGVYTGEEDFDKQYILTHMYPNDSEVYDYILKEGDYLKVTVSQTNPTLGAKMTGLFLKSYNRQSIFCSYGRYIGNDYQ